MPPARDRSAWHDTTIYSSEDQNTALAGLWAAYGISNGDLYKMLEVICVFSDTYFLQNTTGKFVERDGNQVLAGDYYIVTDGSITITEEVRLVRTKSQLTGPRHESFRNSVRVRDQRCIITGVPTLLGTYGWWNTFEAAHVFPLAYLGQWQDNKFDKLISVPPANLSHGLINSVQNGMLLMSQIHVMFDSYCWSIDPDDGPKLVCFTPDTQYHGFPGRHLDKKFLEDPNRVADDLLRWHFRQAVLINMRRG